MTKEDNSREIKPNAKKILFFALVGFIGFAAVFLIYR